MSVTGFSGITPNNQPYNDRTVLDANYIVSIALPNAGNTVNTNALDLFNAGGAALPNSLPFSTTETINFKVLTTQSTGANSKNINVVLQHCGQLSNGAADTSNWANIPTLGAPIEVIAGNATNFPASSITGKLPPGTKQFIRAQATGEANGGDSSNGTLTLELAF